MSDIGLFRLLDKNLMTYLLLFLKPYEIVFVTEMLSKAMQEYTNKITWKSLVHRYFFGLHAPLTIVVKDKYYKVRDYDHSKFLILTRRSQFMYIMPRPTEHIIPNIRLCYAPPRNINKIYEDDSDQIIEDYFDFTETSLYDKLHYTTESSKVLNDKPELISDHLFGIPNPKEQPVWVTFKYHYVYPSNSRNMVCVMELSGGDNFRSREHDDPLKIEIHRIYRTAYDAVMTNIYDPRDNFTNGMDLYENFMEVFSKDDRAVEFLEPNSEEDQLKMDTWQGHEHGYYTLSVTSRDIIAESYGFPVPFTQSNFLTFLIGGMDDGTINEIRSDDMILKRMTLMPFNVKLPTN